MASKKVKEHSEESRINKDKLLEMTNFRCAHCGKTLKYDDATIEHIFPVSKGGTNNTFNTTVLCKECNNNKSNFTINDIINHYKYIDKQYIDSYDKRYNDEVNMGNTGDRLVNFDEVSFYYMPSAAGDMAARMCSRKLNKPKLLKFLNSQMKQLSFEKAYYSSVKEILDVLEKQGTDMDGHNIYEILEKEPYILRDRNYNALGLVVIDKLDEDVDIEGTGLKAGYIMDFAVFHRGVDECGSFVLSYIMLTMLQKGYTYTVPMLTEHVIEDYVKVADGYQRPSVEYTEEALFNYIETSRIITDAEEINKAVQYLIRNYDKLTSDEIEKFDNLFNMSNLYAQLFPREITNVTMKHDKDFAGNAYMHLEWW